MAEVRAQGEEVVARVIELGGDRLQLGPDDRVVGAAGGDQAPVLQPETILPVQHDRVVDDVLGLPSRWTGR
ncbi:hypothetical protein [Streptomyces griseofuscus]|uniref:hypothetical protein n=1 Tax=Streptomyces griseofuscus TaxID=146922 RepID=UPI0033E26EB2